MPVYESMHGTCPVHYQPLADDGLCVVDGCHYKPGLGYPVTHRMWGRMGGGYKGGSSSKGRRKSPLRLRADATAKQLLKGIHARTIPLGKGTQKTC